MNVDPAEVSLAYTYAWWLTGSAVAARTAVLAAVDRPDVPGADPDLRVEILLRRVRAAAIAEPTMCPASELALLHDAIGLGLDAAAGLAMIDARDARTELAHGRLEALDAGTVFEITEPERLGGLAVGNPADVAAARQNPELATLRDAIFRGRDELVDVARVDVPADLLRLIADRGQRQDGGVPIVQGDDDWFQAADWSADDEAAGSGPDSDVVPAELPDTGVAGPDPVQVDVVGRDAADGPARDADGPAPDVWPGADDAAPRKESTVVPAGIGAGGDDTSGHDGEVAEEIDLTPRVPDAAAGGAPSPQRRVRVGWLVVGLVVIAGVVALLTGTLDGVVPSTEATGEDQLADGADVGDDVDEVEANPDAASEDTDAPDSVLGTDAPDASTTEPDAPESGVGTTPEASAGPDATTDPVAPDPDEPGATGSPVDTASAAPPAAAFELTEAGVAVGIGADPDTGNPEAGPFDPISVTVGYRGALEDDALLVDWSVDDAPFDAERADLSPLLESARFSKQVPEAGWPVGQHTLTFTLERTGEVLGEAEFLVIDPAGP